jgi:hypothetical protein
VVKTQEGGVRRAKQIWEGGLVGGRRLEGGWREEVGRDRRGGEERKSVQQACVLTATRQRRKSKRPG